MMGDTEVTEAGKFFGKPATHAPEMLALREFCDGFYGLDDGAQRDAIHSIDDTLALGGVSFTEWLSNLREQADDFGSDLGSCTADAGGGRCRSNIPPLLPSLLRDAAVRLHEQYHVQCRALAPLSATLKGQKRLGIQFELPEDPEQASQVAEAGAVIEGDRDDVAQEGASSFAHGTGAHAAPGVQVSGLTETQQAALAVAEAKKNEARSWGNKGKRRDLATRLGVRIDAGLAVKDSVANAAALSVSAAEARPCAVRLLLASRMLDALAGALPVPVGEPSSAPGANAVGAADDDNCGGLNTADADTLALLQDIVVQALCPTVENRLAIHAAIVKATLPVIMDEGVPLLADIPSDILGSDQATIPLPYAMTQTEVNRTLRALLITSYDTFSEAYHTQMQDVSWFRKRALRRFLRPSEQDWELHLPEKMRCIFAFGDKLNPWDGRNYGGSRDLADAVASELPEGIEGVAGSNIFSRGGSADLDELSSKERKQRKKAEKMTLAQLTASQQVEWPELAHHWATLADGFYFNRWKVYEDKRLSRKSWVYGISWVAIVGVLDFAVGSL